MKTKNGLTAAQAIEELNIIITPENRKEIFTLVRNVLRGIVTEEGGSRHRKTKDRSLIYEL